VKRFTPHTEAAPHRRRSGDTSRRWEVFPMVVSRVPAQASAGAETLGDRSGTQRGPQLPDLRRVVRARSSAASSASRDDRWPRAALPIIASS
jgi:hypothetical protein